MSRTGRPPIATTIAKATLAALTPDRVFAIAIAEIKGAAKGAVESRHYYHFVFLCWDGLGVVDPDAFRRPLLCDL